MEESSPIESSDCCGNGCANCILDHQPLASQRAQLEGQDKHNVLLNYSNYRLIQRQTYAGDDQVLLLHFAHLPNTDENELENDLILDVPPGHHVMLKVGSLLRPYSPYWTDYSRREFKILVKLQSGGPMSQHLAAVQPNDLFQFRGPIGQYVHEARVAKRIFIIAQGVAIAPTLPLVSEVLENEDDMSRIWHLVCARDLQHVYFREQLLEFAKFWNYRSCLYLSQQECSQIKALLRYKEQAKMQRLNGQELGLYAQGQDLTTVLIIAGDARFQQLFRETAATTLKVSEENIYLL